MTVAAPARTILASNALSRYYSDVELTMKAVAMERTHDVNADFTPGFELPKLDARVEALLSVSHVACATLGEYRGKTITLLDLMRNPRTRTTKTFASLLMIARAVHHVRETGEPILIVTPSSANKATALRDAVLRAIESGVVEPEQLRIATLVPATSRSKLWSSALDADPRLRALNPMVLYDGDDPGGVKRLARRFVDEYGSGVKDLNGVNVWYTLDIDNYKVADAIRAFFEQEFMPAPGEGRVHAHAVSSAFGLLGHALGHRMRWTGIDGAPAPSYFLVQHLDTPDMVLSLLHGSTSRDRMPEYAYEPDTGLYRQDSDPHFPATTFDPHEILDPTFYTRTPPTSVEMNELIRTQGGGGVVVSLHECLQRYAMLRALLAPADVHLPADPRRVREWSLVMALTGVLGAIDRGLIDRDEVVVHGSGCYSRDDFSPIPDEHLHRCDDLDGFKHVVSTAAAPSASGRGR